MTKLLIVYSFANRYHIYTKFIIKDSNWKLLIDTLSQMDLYMDNKRMSMFKIIDLTVTGQVYYFSSS
jgi:hypothetical protein